MSNNIFAQTEHPNKIIIDTILKTKPILPQNIESQNIENPYPSILTIDMDDLYGEKEKENPEVDSVNSINPDLLFVRSVFSQYSDISKEITPDYSIGIRQTVIEKDFGKYIKVFNPRTLRWELMPRSNIGIGTIIRWIKRIF